MGKQPFISHVVNGYSRYDVPESKAFTCTPGILYPVRIDFINGRDRVSIEQGIDVRSNPLAVPTFNPYTVRLHRFWVPLQLYHPELRTNSSKFDMNALSLNWVTALVGTAGTANPNSALGTSRAYSNSLMSWLRISNKASLQLSNQPPYAASLPSGAAVNQWANADTYLAYWDIVRNYYSYPQWSLYSIAWPASWSITSDSFKYNKSASFFKQEYANLEFLDAYFESQFYPSAVSSTNNTFNRGNLFFQIINSQLDEGGNQDGYPVSTLLPSSANIVSGNGPDRQFATTAGSTSVTGISAFLFAHPMAVVPSNPDRFSRLIPTGSNAAVSMTGVSTIPQLAIASRLQEYKDLLGAGGNRYSDWLETFFASKIEHVDRPKLLFSASQTVNVQVIMNQAGTNNFQSENGDGFPLGQQGGAIAFNTRLGRRQSYYFREPGYMIDMLSIRPVYYWSGITPDYLNYQGSDYFNPIYNDVGYQDVPAARLFSNAAGSNLGLAVAYEPCFNEFRSSYDEVLGALSSYPTATTDTSIPLYSYWVQQRSLGFSYVGSAGANYYPALFVDMAQVNSPFVSNTEDNFFVNISYAVQKKILVNKTFATRLSNR
jgi:hypothetical protein